MLIREPEELYHEWAKAFNAGDREGLLTLYEPEASLVAQPGQIVKGRAAIGQALEGLLALKGKIEMRLRLVVPGTDLTLVLGEWELEGTDPTGQPLKLGSQTTDVIRRQPDGGLLIAIDNPYGTQAITG
jgi:uncharacterized protein (TIGR02246 family)